VGAPLQFAWRAAHDGTATGVGEGSGLWLGLGEGKGDGLGDGLGVACVVGLVWATAGPFAEQPAAARRIATRATPLLT